MPALVNFSAQPYSVELREVPVPEIGADDVLLAVHAVEICGSDLHQYSGKASWRGELSGDLWAMKVPGSLPKKGAPYADSCRGIGVVSETAAVIDAASPYSRQGLYVPGSQSSRIWLRSQRGRMTKFGQGPGTLPASSAGTAFLRTLAALTEPCCVAYNAVCVNSHIRPGDTVAVIGPGPIGLLCAVMAKLAGAGHVVVIGILAGCPPACGHGENLGAHTVLGRRERGHSRMWSKGNFGDGYGFDLVADAAGVSATLKLAMDIVRPAGQITKVGWGPQPLNFSLDPLVQKAVTLQGSFSHNWPIWEKVIALLARGEHRFEPDSESDFSVGGLA